MILAGTGHRPNKLGGYNAYTTKRVLEFAEHVLRINQPSTVISGMAQGWDIALAQASINLGIPFFAYVPFQGQEQLWPSASRLYYKALLNRAQYVRICSPGGYSLAAMQKRNELMVDDCDELAALWDGSLGGTANCISYANFKGKSVTNYWSEFANQTDPPTADWLS